MIERPRRVVFDTNVIISAVLRPGSVPACAIQHASNSDVILISEAATAELVTVLQRPKFQGKISQSALYLLSQITAAFEPIIVLDQIQDCRDPRDNIFLSLALAGQADLIISGDADLLALHPWRNIPILTPADFLAQASAHHTPSQP